MKNVNELETDRTETRILRKSFFFFFFFDRKESKRKKINPSPPEDNLPRLRGRPQGDRFQTEGPCLRKFEVGTRQKGHYRDNIVQ